MSKIDPNTEGTDTTTQNTPPDLKAFEKEGQINRSLLETSADLKNNLSMTSLNHQDSHLKGFCFMNGFCLALVAQSIIFKFLMTEGVAVIDFVFFRNAANLFTMAFILKSGGHRPFADVPRKRICDLFVRSLSGTISFYLFTYNLKLIPMGIHMIIFQTNPFWLALLGYFINKDAVQRSEIVAMIACFVGVIIIGMQDVSDEQTAATIATDDGSLADDTADERTRGMMIAGSMISFLVAWMFSVQNVLNRRMKSMHFSVIMFNYALLGLTLSVMYLAIQAMITGEGLQTYTGVIYGWIILACIFDVIELNCVTIAFQVDKPSFVALVGQLNIIYAFLADYLIFGEAPGTAQYIGGAIIFTATLTIGIMKAVESDKEQ